MLAQFKTIDKGQAFSDQKCVHIKKDGSTIDVECSGLVERDGDKHFLYVAVKVG